MLSKEGVTLGCPHLVTVKVEGCISLQPGWNRLTLDSALPLAWGSKLGF